MNNMKVNEQQIIITQSSCGSFVQNTFDYTYFLNLEFMPALEVLSDMVNMFISSNP